MLASPPHFPLFLDTYSLLTSSLGCKVLCIVMGFLVLWSIFWSSSLNHFKHCILREGQHRCLSLWRNFCNILWFRVVFFFSRVTVFFFNFFFSMSSSLMVLAFNVSKFLQVCICQSGLVTFRPLVKQTTTRNLYNNIYLFSRRTLVWSRNSQERN